MEEELSNFGKVLKANSIAKGLGTLEKKTLVNPSFARFNDPFLANKEKRDIIVNDSLLNEKNFMTYWKAREKHRDPSKLAHQIQMATIDDVDKDGFDELVAYYNDGLRDNVIGYNQYALGAPISSQKKAKATYYRKPASERENESYADFLAANPETYLEGWTTEAAIKKYKEGLEKKLITKVKKYFTDSVTGYKDLKPKDKTAIANAFISIVAEAMIDDDANRAQAAVVKGMKGFIEAKKALVEELIQDTGVKKAAKKIVEQIISGNAAMVEAYIQHLADARGKVLSVADITSLFTTESQNKYVHSLVSKVPDFNQSTHGTGYDNWMKERYAGGYTPTTAAHNFLGPA